MSQPILGRRRFVGAACLGTVAVAAASVCRALPAQALEEPATFVEDGLLYCVLDADAETPAVSVGVGLQLEPDAQGDALQDASQTSVTVPATVTHDGVTYAVTQIAPYAFQNSQLQEIELSEGLEKIGKSSFQFARELRSVRVPASVRLIGAYAFFAANSLAAVDFAEGALLTEIADGAFAIQKTSGSVENNDIRASLTSVVFPPSLKILGSYAFYGQSELASVVFEGDSLTSISPYCFGRCTALERIDIPTLTSTIERIGRYAFEGDVNLKVVTFQGGVTGTQTTQAGNEFNGCTGVETVIYYDKKWNASNQGSNPPGSAFGSSFAMGVAGFADAPQAREYYTVRQYATQEDAAAQSHELGYAVVPAGTPLHDISSGACEILEQENFEPGPWAYLGGTFVAGLDDSTAAFVCDEDDLTYATVAIDAPIGDEGEPVVPANELVGGVAATVWDPAGVELVAATDYTVRYEDNQGATVEVGIESAPGYYTLFIDGVGAYHGSTYAYFTVSGAPEAWTRLAASNWEEAMQLATRAVFPNASVAETPCLWAVVSAGGEDSVGEALAAASLAGALDAPLLLTSGDTLSEAVAYEINRGGASTVVIVGDTAVVPQAAEDALSLLYVVEKVYRIAGTNTADTAARVLSLAPSLGVQWGSRCVVGSLNEPTPVLAASSWAYAQHAPVLWTVDGALAGTTASACGGAGITGAVVFDSALQAPLEEAGLAVETVGADTDALAAWALGQGARLDGSAVTNLDEVALAVNAAALAGRAGALILDATTAATLATASEGFSHGWILGSSAVVSDADAKTLAEVARA